MYDKEAVASKLRGLRAERRMTQVDVAENIKCSPNTVGNYEAGRLGMDIEIAWALADLYGVTLDELVGRKPKD